MAAEATGVRIVFFGSHKQPSYVVETCNIPSKDQLNDGEILIKILLATICSTDVENIDGKREVKTPCVLGHEGIGEVIFSKRNENCLSAFYPGDRVVFTMTDTCGICNMCKSEMQECCSSIIKYGSQGIKEGSGLNGTYATHMVLKKGTKVVRVPMNVSNVAASPVNCALSTMIHAINFVTTNTKIQSSIAIIQGANLMGLYGCALLNEAGFKKVYCHDISQERLRLVPKFGGLPILVEKEYEMNNGEVEENSLADVVIDVCGAWDVVPYALNALCHRGTYLFVGTAHRNTESTLNINAILKKCLTIKGIQGYTAVHLEKAVEFLSLTVEKYPYELLISSPMPLQDFHSAVTLARSKKYYRTAVKPQHFSLR